MMGRFAALAFCRADVLFELADDLTIDFALGPTEPVFGAPAQQLVGKSFTHYLSPEDVTRISNLFRQSGTDARVDDVVASLIDRQGRRIRTSISGYRVPEFDNHFFVALKIAPRQLGIAGTDALVRDRETGMLDSQSFVQAATERIKAIEAQGAHAKVSMVHIGDLFDFESAAEYSDAIDALSHVLNEQSLGGDTAAKIDDENFSLVHDDAVTGDQLSARISAALSSAGSQASMLMPKIATVDPSQADLTDRQFAKALMYSLQQFTASQGEMADGNLHEILDAKLKQNMAAADKFRAVCDNGEFDLVFMPICSLKTGGIDHFEALTRFRDAAGESPFQLITLAEEIGIIAEFDLVVAKRAIEMALPEISAGSAISYAVNVSGHSIGDTAFCSKLMGLLAPHPGLQKHISIEITESAAIEDLSGVNAAIQDFRDMGFKVALDDFGAGAASFDYLNSFDVDIVKFDGPVVKRAVKTRRGRAFLKSMATLCSEIGVETIAEMVENEDLAVFLRDSGVGFGQGWHFGKPSRRIADFLGSDDSVMIVNPGIDLENRLGRKS